MKTKEMVRIIEEVFGGTIDLEEEIGINDHHAFVAYYVDKYDSAIDSNSIFSGFLVGHAKTKNGAVRNLYTTIRAVCRNTVKQVECERR